MVVTASLARGAVRAAVEKHNEVHADFWARVRKTGMVPPSTRRKFAEWFQKRKSVHEKDALLIATGMVRRRSGAFVAFHPQFREIENGWTLGIYSIRIVVSPGRTESIDQQDLPVEISGHALERMFQRTNAIEWRIIREYLASATLFVNAVAKAYAASGCQQCAIPADRGLLVGQIADNRLTLRTFLPDAQLGPRWQSLYDDLRTFVDGNIKDISSAAILSNQELDQAFESFLRSGRRDWMFKPYVLGVDYLEDAWRSREQTD